MDLYAKIKEMAESLIKNDQLFVVDLNISAKRVPGKVTLFIDGDQGATIDDCANLSRALGKQLEESDLIHDSFTLEVSTPGVEHPLRLMRQYPKHVGRQLKITLKNNEQLKGKLLGVSAEFLDLKEEVKEGKKKAVKETRIAFEEIDKALVMISFN